MIMYNVAIMITSTMPKGLDKGTVANQVKTVSMVIKQCIP